MASPVFSVLVSATNPIPGQSLIVDVFSSETLAAEPSVLFGGVRPATYLDQIGTRAYRFSYIVSSEDNGSVTLQGNTSGTGEAGTTILNDVFTLRFSGQAEVPFGQQPFGYSFFGYGLTFPEPITLTEFGFDFAIRRGQEGPQIITTWNNSGGLNLRLLRKELDYPEDENDGELVYSGTAEKFADIHVVDGTIYYYSLFVENVDLSIWIIVGKGHLRAIDNQPYVDWNRLAPVLSRTTSVQPIAPADGDRYLLPTGSTGAEWAGNDGSVAEWDNDNTEWVFTVPTHLMFLEVEDETAPIVYRLDRWQIVNDKDRFNLYELLTDYDKKMDESSSYGILARAVAPTFDDENFNFDMANVKARPTLMRMLKNLNLPMAEVKGVIDAMDSAYDVSTADVDLLPAIGALVGWDDYDKLDNPLRRFLIGEAHSFWPRVGSDEFIDLGISMWLGTSVRVERKSYATNLVTANVVGLGTPIVTPVPNPTYDTYQDEVAYVTSLNTNDEHHSRSLKFYIDKPFDPFSWTVLGTVKSATTTTPPGSPLQGDLYIVPVGATGDWLGLDNTLVLQDSADVYAGAGGWVPQELSDRDAYIADDDETTYIWREIRNEWATPIDSTAVERLTWWLEEVAVAGSVNFELVELVRELQDTGEYPLLPDVSDLLAQWEIETGFGFLLNTRGPATEAGTELPSARLVDTIETSMDAILVPDADAIYLLEELEINTTEEETVFDPVADTDVPTGRYITTLRSSIGTDVGVLAWPTTHSNEPQARQASANDKRPSGFSIELVADGVDPVEDFKQHVSLNAPLFDEDADTGVKTLRDWGVVAHFEGVGNRTVGYATGILCINNSEFPNGVEPDGGAGVGELVLEVNFRATSATVGDVYAWGYYSDGVPELYAVPLLIASGVTYAAAHRLVIGFDSTTGTYSFSLDGSTAVTTTFGGNDLQAGLDWDTTHYVHVPRHSTIDPANGGTSGVIAGVEAFIGFVDDVYIQDAYLDDAVAQALDTATASAFMDWVTGPISEWALRGTGTSYIDALEPILPTSSVERFAIEMFINHNGDTEVALVDQSENNDDSPVGDNNAGISLWFDANGDLELGIKDNADDNTRKISRKINWDGANNGNFVHLLAQYDGSQRASGIRIFVEGVEGTTLGTVDDIGLGLLLGNGHLTTLVGARNSEDPDRILGASSISMVTVFNDVLTETQIAARAALDG